MDRLTTPIPIDQIVAASAFSSSLPASPVTRGFKRLTILYAFPQVLKFVLGVLPNDRIAHLTELEAKELYVPLAALHRELQRELIGIKDKHRILSATLLRWWLGSMESRTERLGDISEALAWSADDSLRENLKDAISHIEQPELHFSSWPA